MEKSAAALILVVDDEPLVRKSVREILSDEGHRTLEAENGAQCLEALEKEAVDLVLLDIQMPGTDGLTTFKERIRRKFQVDVIIMSGHGNISIAVESVKFGALDFLEKPFSSAKLKEAVAAGLRKREEERRVSSLRKQGRTLGPYLIEEEIASGASATVYRALHPGLDRKVALKVLHAAFSGDKDFTARFEREARVTALLTHPNIVQIYDCGLYEGLHCLSMEFVDGATLKDEIKASGRLSLHRVVHVAMEVCMALDHAHNKGVIHRDIKPTNILISRDGAVKLADFGIARVLDKSGFTLTRADQMVGTPLFMSPEQVNGDRVEAASDLFSMGTLLYYLATGAFPFTGATLPAIAQAIEKCEFEEPVRRNPSVPEGLNRIIMACLQKKPKQRFASAMELRRALEKE